MNPVSLTFDVEDWSHPELVRALVPPGDTRTVVVEGTERILELLRRHRARASFFVLGDVAVPRGTPVFLLTRPAQRQGRFGAPAEFRPERWLDEERGALAHDPKAHIPFGSGPRLCPGRSLATLEARVALATLCKGFELEPRGRAAAERYTSIMVPSAVRLRLRAR